MWQIKQIPEDFVVREISQPPVQESGRYLYFRLHKKNYNTLEALRLLAEKLHLREKQFGFAGSKDRKAVTEQVCSIYGTSKEHLLALQLKDLTLDFLGYGAEPISLGDLEGNAFEIVVRNLDSFSHRKVELIPNYFDEQRFSSDNVAIGRALVKKDFASAAKQMNHLSVQQHLQLVPHDSVGALKSLPMRLLRLYLHAYQSYLWNEILAQYLRKKGVVAKELDYSLGKLVFVDDPQHFGELKVPLLGFAAEELIKDEGLGEIISQLMEKESLSYSDFVLRQFSNLALEGGLRAAMVLVQKLSFGPMEEDELNPGKKKVKICFSLGKGSYATLVVKWLLG